MSESNDSDSKFSSEAGGSGSLLGGRGRGSSSPHSRGLTDSRRSSDTSKSIDISNLEKDSEKLSRKAQKRLSKSNVINFDTFLDKMINWQRKRKLDKIRNLLETLFPKLKHTEEEVKQWLDEVSERKEVYASHGQTLLTELQGQISAHQSNLDFLDEAINDVKQIDYDIVREINELKSAYCFNQEILRRSSTPRLSTSSSTSRGSPRHAGSAGIAAEIVGSPSLLNGDVIRCVHDKRLLPTSPAPIVPPAASSSSGPYVPVSDPAVWQGVKEGVPTRMHFATSPFTRSLSKLLMTNGGGDGGGSSRSQPGSRCSTPTKSNSSGSSSSGRRSPTSTSLKKPMEPAVKSSSEKCSPMKPRCLRDEVVDDEVVWGGAESKRKSLQHCAVPVQSLLNQPQQTCQQGVAECKGRTRSASGASALLKSAWSTPTTLIIPSADKKYNTLHDLQSHPPLIPHPISVAGVGSGSNSVINQDRLSSLLKRFPDDPSLTITNLDMDCEDADQAEICQRIQKCKKLKETLKRVLETLQDTLDDQTLGLRRIKRMRVELKNLFDNHALSNVSCSSLGSSRSGTFDPVPSNGSLTHLSDSLPGSASSGPHLLYATLDDSPGLPEQHWSASTTITPPIPRSESGTGSSGRSACIDPMAFTDPALSSVAGDYVSDLKSLLEEEQDARNKLARLSNLIDSALVIDRKLQVVSPGPKTVF
eukprot:gene6931-7668_t